MRCLLAWVSHSDAKSAIKSDVRARCIGVAGKTDRLSANNAHCRQVPSNSTAMARKRMLPQPRGLGTQTNRDTA
eukprot:2901519-Lingulodinium_polyedra.AAC.1